MILIEQPTEQPTQTDLISVKFFIVSLIGADAVDQCAGRADLNAGTAFDTGAFAKRNISICNDHAGRAAFCD
jgi:hypothetical protein